MNKTKIKNFSIWARRNLIEVVAYRMRFLGIDENGIKPEMDGSTDKLKLYDMGTSKPAEVAGEDIEKRVCLASHIKDHEKTSDYKTAYETMVEEIAYTWFNRLIAIRFMEVNDYLPSGVRVLSSESGKREPDIVTKAVEVAEDQGFSITKEEIWKLKEENKLDELFRIMFIQQCKKLHAILPELFDNSKDDYTEFLLPISFIDDDAFIRHLVTDIDEDDFNISKIDENTGKPVGQVEIIGWLYQYYNTEKKDAVFAAMSNKVKVSKENIAAATQLFTPDWIVRYMVENSLGRIFIDKRKREGVYADGRGLDELTWDEFESQRIKTEQFIADQMGWKYYLPEAAQSPDVAKQLEEIWKEQPNLNLEQIRFIDPCMGSGHILVYAFDVFMQMYISRGYTERDAAQNIVRHNLWGLDLDKRAYQLAYFAVMMKARQYDRRFLTRGIKPNLSHFQDLLLVDYSLLDDTIASFVKQFENADTYGSLITVQADDEIDSAIDSFEGKIGFDRTHLEHFMQLYKILSQRYDVVCTNPPYMAMANANNTLKKYVEKKYADSKSDLFAIFIERCSELTNKNGYYSMITQHAWMFLASFEKLRAKLHFKTTINMAHLGSRAFDEINGEVVQTTSFVNCNTYIPNYIGAYKRLIDGSNEAEKCAMFLSNDNYYTANSANFSNIPGSPVAYWVSENFFTAYEKGKLLGDLIPVKKGLDTGENDKYLRLWHEVSFDKLGIGYKSSQAFTDATKKWAPHDKGGEFHRWYGNKDWVINWENNGYALHNSKANLRSEKFYFSDAITWSSLSSGTISFRYSDYGALSNTAGSSMYPKYEKYYYLGLTNSKVAQLIYDVISPTLNYSAGPVSQLAVIKSNDNNQISEIDYLVEENIKLVKEDWDCYETSWDFKEHPFVKWSKELWDCTAIGAAMSHYYGKHIEVSCPLELCYLLWQGECNERFNKLKANEEELNRIFIDIYGLQDELTPEVDDKDVTVRKADLQRDMRSFVSYAVGCMFGRYSLDREGLVFAGGDFDRVYWKHKGQAPLDENGEVPFGGGYAGVSIAPYNYPRFWNDAHDWEDTPYLRFAPDADNCLPITEEHFFEDDIVTQFVNFVKAVFGEDSLEDNLRYVAENLGIKGSGTAREKIRQYFLKEFFKDHCKVYQKRPIYWQFDTGKKNGFKALCYVHRWTVNTVGSVRIDYMHKLQRLYRNEIIRLKENIDAGEEIAKSQKRLEKITNQLQETEEYDAKIGIVVAARTEIDLDDGVKVNYDKVQTGSDGKHYQILAKI